VEAGRLRGGQGNGCAGKALEELAPVHGVMWLRLGRHSCRLWAKVKGIVVDFRV
jgi:hypothetical protein